MRIDAHQTSDNIDQICRNNDFGIVGERCFYRLQLPKQLRITFEIKVGCFIYELNCLSFTVSHQYLGLLLTFSLQDCGLPLNLIRLRQKRDWNEVSNQDCKQQMSWACSSRGGIFGFGKARGEYENVLRKETSADGTPGIEVGKMTDR